MYTCMGGVKKFLKFLIRVKNIVYHIISVGGLFIICERKMSE